MRPKDLRLTRIALVVGSAVYLAWWFVVEAFVPGAYNPFASRFAIVAFGLAIGVLAVVSRPVARRADLAYLAATSAITTHYFYLFHQNAGDPAWAIGAYVTVLAVATCFVSRRAAWGYFALTVVLGVLVTALHPALMRWVFAPGLLTVSGMSLLATLNRLGLIEEVERSHDARDRAEVERRLFDAATEGVRVRDEFIALAGHEMRTPLTPLTLQLDGLARMLRTETSGDRAASRERVRSQIEGARRQVQRLTRLVNGLLDASRIAAGRLELERVDGDLAQIVRHATDALAPEARRAGCELTVSAVEPVPGAWDATRIEQALSNLVRNAIGFGCGKPVTITVDRRDGMARIEIEDHGIGIAPETLARIFDRFERAVPSVNYGGMGLGLYVAKGIVDAHGGSIRVRSEVGAGTDFVVELPMRA